MSLSPLRRLRTFIGSPFSFGLSLIVLAGMALRVLYVLKTPYDVRAYDWDGHMEYIKYVAKHLALPPANGGWEFFQPPLYYIVAGMWTALGRMAGRSAEMIVRDLQFGSLLISCAVLLVGVWIGSLIFPLKKDRPWFLLFSSVLAVFPSLVFISSRVSNDVPMTLMQFLVVGVLCRWWKTKSSRAWLLLSLLIAMGLLTKSSALLLIPVALSLLLLNGKNRWKRKACEALVLLAILGITVGISHIPESRRTGVMLQWITGNTASVNPDLRVRNTLIDYTTFQPVQILRHPYNNTWNDDERRTYFFEFFFRSAFFGEFRFPDALYPLAILLLSLGLCSLPLMAFGCYRDIVSRERLAIPIAMTLLGILAGHIAYRMRFPISPSQDFRYSLILVVPLTYYLLNGIRWLPRRIRTALALLVAGFSAACAAFLIGIALTS